MIISFFFYFQSRFSISIMILIFMFHVKHFQFSFLNLISTLHPQISNLSPFIPLPIHFPTYQSKIRSRGIYEPHRPILDIYNILSVSYQVSNIQFYLLYVLKYTHTHITPKFTP
jgi:hypothetical protein